MKKLMLAAIFIAASCVEVFAQTDVSTSLKITRDSARVIEKKINQVDSLLRLIIKKKDSKNLSFSNGSYNWSSDQCTIAKNKDVTITDWIYLIKTGESYSILLPVGEDGYAVSISDKAGSTIDYYGNTSDKPAHFTSDKKNPASVSFFMEKISLLEKTLIKETKIN